MALAQAYGEELYTGVFFKNPEPPPTYEALVRERQKALAGKSVSRERVREMFVQK